MCCRSEWQERMYIYKWHEVDKTKHEIFCVHIVCNEIQVKVNLEIATFFFYLRFPYCPNFFWFGVVDLFLTNMQLFTAYYINWWTGVVWITCGLLWRFISCLDSHSDGTHSLQRIHWWASNIMLHFSQSFPMKKQTYLHPGWPAEWVHLEQMIIWTIPLKGIDNQKMAFVIINFDVIQNPYGCIHKMSKNAKMCLLNKKNTP